MGLGYSLRFVLVLCVLFTLSGRSHAFNCADTALIAGQAATASMGDIVSTFDSDLQTRLYFGLSEPGRDGTIPLVATNARAVAIYFHGSGTKKAGGKGFIHRMQNLAAAGVAPLSLDLPFHSDGPRDASLHDMNRFMEWLHRLIVRLQVSKKPIYFIGHSFGPLVALEYAARYPKDIAGALLISACTIKHPAVQWTYDNITVPGMPLFLDEDQIMTNEAGLKWALDIGEQTTWERRPAPPTEFVFLRGTEDEWFPENAWLPAALGLTQKFPPRVVEQAFARKFPATARFRFIDKVGHYIFDAKNAAGKNAIIEEAFDMVGVPQSERYPAQVERSARTQLASLRYNSPVFNDWVGNRYTHLVRDEQHAYEGLLGWHEARLRMWIELLERIPNAYPDFYEARKLSVEILRHEAEKERLGLKSGRRREVSAHIVPWSDAATFFQAELSAYLEAKAEGRVKELDRDPLGLHYPIEEALLQPGKMTSKGIRGPLTEEAFVQSVAQSGGTVLGVERDGDSTVARITYAVGQQQFQANVIEQGKGLGLVRDAFAQACRQRGWQIVTERWEVQVRGVKVKGILKSGVLSDVEITDVGNIPLTRVN